MRIFKRRFAVSLALGGAMVLALAASALSFNLAALLNGGAQPDKFKIIHVSDLARMIKTHSTKVWLYDANDAETRAEYGIIPGARLLNSDDHYNVAADLPADHGAKLVFYCTNHH